MILTQSCHFWLTSNKGQCSAPSMRQTPSHRITARAGVVTNGLEDPFQTRLAIVTTAKAQAAMAERETVAPLAAVGASVHAVRVVLELAMLGSEIPVVALGVEPSAHSQQGSPSSRPLDWPSPSLSATHRAVVHMRPAPLNAIPNAFLGPPPALAMWPTPGWLGTESQPFQRRTQVSCASSHLTGKERARSETAQSESALIQLTNAACTTILNETHHLHHWGSC